MGMAGVRKEGRVFPAGVTYPGPLGRGGFLWAWTKGGMGSSGRQPLCMPGTVWGRLLLRKTLQGGDPPEREIRRKTVGLVICVEESRNRHKDQIYTSCRYKS